MKLKTRWHLHVVVMLTPLSIPLAAGAYWLWLNQMLLWWALVSSLLGSGWWLVNRRLPPQDSDLEWLDISEAVADTPQSRSAYQKIEAIATARRTENPDLASSQYYLQTALEVMRSVAEHYHPERKDALMEIRLPYLLKVIERFAQDLRVNLSENIPGSHLFSLNDIVRSRRFADRGRELYRLLRIVSAGLDPVSAMIRELKLLATANVLSRSTDDLRRWLIDAYIKKIGYYAIELYSGNLVLDEQLFARPTRASRRELKAIQCREAALSAEPFRILVLGQTNAGKSSLINALFGEMKAETDVLPTTRGIVSYRLGRPGLETALIMDCEGYGADDCAATLTTVSAEIVRSDMILLVTSASNAARDLDKKMLTAVRNEFADQGRRSLPPVIIALTHVDQLRPVRDWRPPYDVSKPTCAKAHAIRGAMDTVGTELGMNIDRIAPVSLKPGFEYNIEEGLVPVIFQHLEQAERTRYLRCLKEYRRQDQRRLLWLQSKRAGQFIAKKGLKVFSAESREKAAVAAEWIG